MKRNSFHELIGWKASLLTFAWVSFIFVLSSIFLVKHAQAIGSEAFSSEQRVRMESSYLKSIRPRKIGTAESGVITNGFLILYGQVVDPPYLFNISNDTLYLNAVQIDPPLMPPWRYKPAPPVTPRARQISDLAARIRAKFKRIKEARGKGEPRASLIQHIKDKEYDVLTAEWIDPETLHLVLRSGEEFSIGFHEVEKVDYSAVREEILRETKRRYEASLSSGALIVIGYGPVLIVPAGYVPVVRARIQEALRKGSREQLRKALLHDELVQEMLFIRNRLMREED